MLTNSKKGLAAYLEASKVPDPLFRDIQRHVLAKAAKPNGRRIDCIHPSEAVKKDWCIRANFYRIVTNTAHNPQQTTFRRENVFQEGHNTHSKWQQWLTEMGKLEGDWRCDSCGEMWYENAPDNCPECGSRWFTYEELRLTHDDLRISGRTDGYIPDEGMLLEIKTLGLGSLQYENPSFLAAYQQYAEGKQWVALDALWRDFRSPLRSARRQGNFYIWLAQQMGINVDRILFIYDFKPTQEAKSFLVEYQPKVIADILENCERIAAAVSHDEPPACNVGESNGCASCRPYEDDLSVREEGDEDERD